MLKKKNLVMISFFLPAFDSNVAVNFIKNIISDNNIEEESTLKIMIESAKKTLIKGTER